MNRSSLIGHVLELLKDAYGWKVPLDNLTANFYRKRKYLGSNDRRFISDTVYNIVRNLRLFEELLVKYISENPSCAFLNADNVRFLPIYASYAILIKKETLEQIADDLISRWKIIFPEIDIMNYLKWISTNQGLDFTNNGDHSKFGIRYSFQDWMVQDFMEQFGDELEKFLHEMNNPAHISLRVNRLKVTREECRRSLLEEGIETDLSPIAPDALIAKKRFNIESLQSFKDGWFEIQDEGSQIVSIIADPQPGQFVIDVCAGAGGKSLHMATLMENSGKILALDIDPNRLREIERRALRAGVSIIEAKLSSSINQMDYLERADIVLIDAPCSGVGTIRRNPHLKWGVTRELVHQYSNTQKTLLNFYSNFVKCNGRLVYATCSLLRDENEFVVNSFLENDNRFEIEENSKLLNQFKVGHKIPFLKLLPYKNGTDGFFIATLRRIN